MLVVIRILVAAVLVVVLPTCAPDDAIAQRGGHAPPASLCRSGMDGRSCLAVEDAEKLIGRDDLEIVAVASTPAGIQGARVLTLRAGGRSPILFRAKWRAQSTATRRNSPRFELGAYEIQKLFLSPREYVVPPAAPHCFPLAAYRASVDKKARATFPDVPCVYGVLSYWLEDVQSLGDAVDAGWFHGIDRHVFDPALFARNDTYRDSLSRVNLLAYVIGHGDTHGRNFVIARDPQRPAVYSVDNSLSLGMRKNSKLSPAHDWSRIRVTLPSAAIERLRAADERLASLSALAYLRVDDGQLVQSSGGGAPAIPTARGFNWTDDDLRYGLTDGEIEAIRGRIDALLATVDRGEIALRR